MTQQRIDEIKKYTIGRALRKLQDVDFSNGNTACFMVGMIFGELDNNLSRELAREKTRNLVMEKRVYSPENIKSE